jgi:cytochrome c2
MQSQEVFMSIGLYKLHAHFFRKSNKTVATGTFWTYQSLFVLLAKPTGAIPSGVMMVGNINYLC